MFTAPEPALRRGIHLIAVSALVALAIAGCTAPTPSVTTEPTAASGLPEETTTAMQAALEASLDQWEIPGVIARVITADGVWNGAAGSVGVDDATLPDADDITRIGSITKTMTGTVILQLVDEGLISLDDPLSKYLPAMPNGDATLLQLANMTAGIASYSLNEQAQADYFGSPETEFTAEQLADFAAALPVDFAPGEGWAYSNSNYILLGLIVEQVTGKPMGVVLEERLFGPLGMTDTDYAASTGQLPSPHLFGVTEQGQDDGVVVDATFWSPSFAAMAGQVSSTMNDLEKWGHAYFTGEGVLSPEMQQLRRDSRLTAPAPNNAESGYGISMGLRDGWWGHTGEIPGFNTALFHDYERDITVIVMVNSDIPNDSGNPAPGIHVELADVLEG